MWREYLSLTDSKINSNTQNFDQSKLSVTQDNQEIDVDNTPLDNRDNRETIIFYKIPNHELSNKIENDNNKKP